MTPNPDFKGTPLFDVEYQKQYKRDTVTILIGTYSMVFRMTLSDSE